MDKKLLGRWGEKCAAEYLKKKKYKIIGLNYSTRFGEVDIIAQNKEFIVFVEVKLRRSDNFAQAKEFVTRAKQERIMITAQSWLQSNELNLQPRFDVIEIYAPEGIRTENLEINHIEDAFN
jgi:TIGR00252 family protein